MIEDFHVPGPIGDPDTTGAAAAAACTTQGQEPKLDVPVDLQAEFATIKDAVQRVKLPPSLRLNDNGKKGIRSADQQALSVIQRSARYSETCMKLIGTLSPETVTQADLDQILVTQTAHIKYLQDEYSTLIVQGKFDNQTASIFKSLQRNTSGLSPQARDNLEVAATLSRNVYLHKEATQQQGNTSPSRGRGQSSYGYRNNYSYNQRGRGFRRSYGDSGNQGNTWNNNSNMWNDNVPSQRPH